MSWTVKRGSQYKALSESELEANGAGVSSVYDQAAVEGEGEKNSLLRAGGGGGSDEE